MTCTALLVRKLSVAGFPISFANHSSSWYYTKIGKAWINSSSIMNQYVQYLRIPDTLTFRGFRDTARIGSWYYSTWINSYFSDFCVVSRTSSCSILKSLLLFISFLTVSCVTVNTFSWRATLPHYILWATNQIVVQRGMWCVMVPPTTSAATHIPTFIFP